MKEFVLKGRLTLEKVTFYVSAKTLEGPLARAVNGDFDGYDTDAKALIGAWLWLRSRRTPNAPPPANASCFATINPAHYRAAPGRPAVRCRLALCRSRRAQAAENSISFLPRFGDFR
jgi:hypothetical protein